MQRRHFVKKTLLTSAGITVCPFLAQVRSAPINPPLSVAVNAKVRGERLVHFWSKCVGAGRANEGLRASWQEQLKQSRDLCGFAYCRFHGLFHDDMFVYHEANGKPVYNWQYVDELFDRMLAIGVRPFVELGFMPKALATDQTSLQFWWQASVTPPKDYSQWAALVSEFTRHSIDRYGLDEVITWYFEVWNEPNLKGFWNGTKSQYFALYKVSVQAIKAIDKRLRVGGPSTSNFVPDERFDGEAEDKTKHKTLTVKDINILDWHGVWISDFLVYCQKEGLPIDFISTHPYPTDWALDPMTGKGGGRVREVNATRKDLEWLKKTITASAYPTAEIHLTEWSSSPSSRDATHDSLQAATYIIKANLDCIGLANSLSYWTFTDVFEEKGAGESLWHGGFGLINFQEIVKPAFHAYRMLHELGDEILRREDGMIVTRHAKTGLLSVLLYHYPAERNDVVDGNIDEVLNIGTARDFSLDLTGLSAKSQFTVETLDRNSGFALEAWRRLGKPAYPGREQTQGLKTQALATRKEQVNAEKGTLAWKKTLPPWTCVLLKETATRPNP